MGYHILLRDTPACATIASSIDLRARRIDASSLVGLGMPMTWELLAAANRDGDCALA
jgi:hypothetical protein